MRFNTIKTRFSDIEISFQAGRGLYSVPNVDCNPYAYAAWEIGLLNETGLLNYEQCEMILKEWDKKDEFLGYADSTEDFVVFGRVPYLLAQALYRFLTQKNESFITKLGSKILR